MKKLLISVTLILSIIFCVSACGNKEVKNNTQTSKDNVAGTYEAVDGKINYFDKQATINGYSGGRYYDVEIDKYTKKTLSLTINDNNTMSLTFNYEIPDIYKHSFNNKNLDNMSTYINRSFDLHYANEPDEYGDLIITGTGDEIGDLSKTNEVKGKIIIKTIMLSETERSKLVNLDFEGSNFTCRVNFKKVE